MKLYSIRDDVFLTDRAAIIDELVRNAGHILTFSERLDNGGCWGGALSRIVKRFLGRALVYDGRERRALYQIVQTEFLTKVVER